LHCICNPAAAAAAVVVAAAAAAVDCSARPHVAAPEVGPGLDVPKVGDGHEQRLQLAMLCAVPCC
jgi:hypothetical protein